MSGMPYDLIQGHGQGHETLKVINSLFSNSVSPPPFTVAAGK